MLKQLGDDWFFLILLVLVASTYKVWVSALGMSTSFGVHEITLLQGQGIPNQAAVTPTNPTGSMGAYS